MKYLLISIITILFSTSVGQAQSQKDKDKAYQYGMEAINLMNKGKFKESIKLLEKSKKLDPNRIDYPYEIAYALYHLKEYKRAIKILEKMTHHRDVTEQHFQLLGNNYDNLKQPERAMQAYRQGLEKFPNSGKLYLEQGNIEYFNENYNVAIDYWEKGVEVDPYFSSNYYWLGKVFSYTEERIWSVLYGEVFINLERNSDRTVEMSRILFDTYKASIHVDSDTSGGVSFSKVMTIDPSKEFKIPFNMSYGMMMSLSLGSVLNKEAELSIRSINLIRQNFITNWYKQERNTEYANVLFDFQKQLQNNGFLESYNYWFLMKGNEEEFNYWVAENEVKFTEFSEWFNANPISITRENYFSRLRY